jgi:hypothetical protein
MLNIPYVGSDRNACALACYTMVAKYFFPETTFEQVAKLSDWKPSYVVWAFKFWNWITKKGIMVTDYDLIGYRDWAENGAKALEDTMSENEFNFIYTHTKDLDALSEELRKLLKNKRFVYHRQRPTFEQLKQAVQEGKPCEVVLNSHVLDHRAGFALHRIVVVDINERQITFHDPRPEPRANRKETIEHFNKAWLKALDEPELCIYSKL